MTSVNKIESFREGPYAQMSDVCSLILPDLGEGAENRAADEHCQPLIQGSGSERGLSHWGKVLW